jgi:NADH-quinone oxidoreductase subunit F
VLTPEEAATTTLDYESMAAHKTMFGSGGIVVLDETVDAVKLVKNLIDFYHHESCGQCTPCREGTGWMNRVLLRILAGRGRAEDLDLLDSVSRRIEGHTICAFGDAAAWPVQSFIRHFRPEFVHMIEHRGRSLVEGAGDTRAA